MNKIKRLLKKVARRLFGTNASPSSKLEWIPAPSILQQKFTFQYRGRSIIAASDYSTPLYETIAELADFDAYQLEKISWPETGPFCVVDIGANIGVAALMLSIVPGAKVACYEPLPANCEALKANVKINDFHNITIHEEAVSVKDGTLTFAPHPDISVAGRLIDGPVGDRKNTITVRTVSLASVMNVYPEIFLMKVDCEGGEYDLIRQITPDIAPRIRNLTFEVHDVDANRNLAVLSSLLETAGYQLSHKADLFGRPHLHHVLATYIK